MSLPPERVDDIVREAAEYALDTLRCRDTNSAAIKAANRAIALAVGPDEVVVRIIDDDGELVHESFMRRAEELRLAHEQGANLPPFDLDVISLAAALAPEVE